jgi:hypothetical protein
MMLLLYAEAAGKADFHIAIRPPRTITTYARNRGPQDLLITNIALQI